MKNIINHSYNHILEGINSTCQKNNRDPKSVKVIAICKRQPFKKILQAIDAGINNFGENRVQDGINRWSKIKSKKINLSFVGPLQTNKSEDAINQFHEVQSLDRPKLAKSLSKAQLKLRKTIQYMVQVNTGHEPQKSGIKPNELDDFIKLCVQDHGLNITGLMCIPPVKENPALHFALMHELFKRNKLKHLSMGMSNDYQTAIEFGATHIRIGSKLFGERLEKEEHKS
mgnify:CR=1 FL=1